MRPPCRPRLTPPPLPRPLHRPQSRVDLLAAADNAGPVLLLDTKKDKRAEKVRRFRVGERGGMAAHFPTLPVSVQQPPAPTYLSPPPPLFSLSLPRASSEHRVCPIKFRPSSPPPYSPWRSLLCVPPQNKFRPVKFEVRPEEGQLLEAELGPLLSPGLRALMFNKVRGRGGAGRWI